MDFNELLRLSGLTIQTAAQHLGVSDKTIYRYIRHGAPAMAHRALEFRAGTNPDYYGLRFRRDGIWCETRKLIEQRDLAEIEWLMQREYLRGRVDGERQK